MGDRKGIPPVKKLYATYLKRFCSDKSGGRNEGEPVNQASAGKWLLSANGHLIYVTAAFAPLYVARLCLTLLVRACIKLAES